MTFQELWTTGVVPCPILGYAPSGIDPIMTFGEPHARSDAHDDSPIHMLYWYFEYACGLKLVVQAPDLPGETDLYLDVMADQCECEHAHFHLGLKTPMTTRLDRGVQAEANRALFPHVDYSCSLMRQDDHGNEAVMFTKLTAREANCLCQGFEARGHKQAYWVDGVD